MNKKLEKILQEEKARLKAKMVSAAGWEGKLKPVYVGGMFFADNPDTMEGCGVMMNRTSWATKNTWALWADGHGFVCADDNMIWPLCAHPLTMKKEVAEKLCKTGIAHWGKIFFVENKDYYAKMIEKTVKRMGFIQLDNPVDVRELYLRKHTYTIDAIDHCEGLRLCAFYFNGKTHCLNCCDTKSIVAVGRELMKTLANKHITL